MMIEGIEPTKADIGRSVIYHSYSGKVESGFITSFNDRFVFVRYDTGSTSQATRRDMLEWAS